MASLSPEGTEVSPGLRVTHETPQKGSEEARTCQEATGSRAHLPAEDTRGNRKEQRGLTCLNEPRPAAQAFCPQTAGHHALSPAQGALGLLRPPPASSENCLRKADETAAGEQQKKRTSPGSPSAPGGPPQAAGRALRAAAAAVQRPPAAEADPGLTGEAALSADARAQTRKEAPRRRSPRRLRCPWGTRTPSSCQRWWAARRLSAMARPSARWNSSRYLREVSITSKPGKQGSPAWASWSPLVLLLHPSQVACWAPKGRGFS